MKRKSRFDPAVHDDNPEWTEADFAKAKPAAEMPDGMLAFFKVTKARLGRPPAETKKVPVKLRLDPEVVDALRASGPGWQTRINAMLAAKIRNGKVSFDKSRITAVVAAKTSAKGKVAGKPAPAAVRNGRKRA